MNYKATIGLEVHIQLKTRTKMFSAAPYKYGAEPNTLIDPVVLALPGTLPVLNYAAILKCVELGLMLDCEIAEECKWDRKNYFYPDSPKNYQLTQNEHPLCNGGSVEIELPGSSRNIQGEHKFIRLNRIHLEEDPGKLTHTAFDSLIDFNRAGVPLAEIVTEPDLKSSTEAVSFLNALRNLVIFSGVSDCNMEKGQMRCDANVSISLKDDELGLRTEMKNLNSISNVKNAIDYEIKRQIEVLSSGQEIVQETRRWDASANKSYSLRSKEDAHDYRYFPDPDLLPVVLEKRKVLELKSKVVERPFERQRRYQSDYGLPYTLTSVLCNNIQLSKFFEDTLSLYNSPVLIANYITNDLLRELSINSDLGESPLNVNQSKIKPNLLAELAEVVETGLISKQIAKDVFKELFSSGVSPKKIIEEKGLIQNDNSSEIESLCKEAIKNNPKAVLQFKEGNAKAINALKGPVMKATKGKANPAMLDSLLQELIKKI